MLLLYAPRFHSERNILVVLCILIRKGTILAQIAITALQLDNVEKVHWTSQACFTVSLVSSIISVYYATKQHKMLGRCLHADDIKKWILGPQHLSTSRGRGTGTDQDQDWTTYDVQLPSVAAVLTISAPVALLSVAVYAFLIGLGIYQGFVWHYGLGDSSQEGNLAVFIVFILSLSACHSLYMLSTMVASGQVNDSEIRPYLEKALHRAVPARSPVHIQLGEMDRAPTYSSAIGPSVPDMKSRGLDDGTQLQAAFREAAVLRRNLAAVDERIAMLLEGMGQGRF